MNKTNPSNLPKTLLAACLLLSSLNATCADDKLFFPTTEEEIINALTLKPKMRGPGGLSQDEPEPPKVGALIHFDFDSADILPESHSLLHKYGRVLQGPLADAILVIAGHTDSIGPKLYNFYLSYQRAFAVKTFLISHYQVADKRFIIKANGESQPINTNRTEQGRAMNRRVEFVRIE
ncbi:MAG: hypothetical protein DRR08_24390 [Candidatus Parabeggiatoa sp. nov. 2]|nr:MAG: hypothetical protein B6247_11720 [Beggiatoa sp. 4572_84]RKZ55432.1 MAG: hypothetical protein DRR08_24390 [Gammaproteobacteria bacterium]